MSGSGPTGTTLAGVPIEAVQWQGADTDLFGDAGANWGFAGKLQVHLLCRKQHPQHLLICRLSFTVSHVYANTTFPLMLHLLHNFVHDDHVIKSEKMYILYMMVYILLRCLNQVLFGPDPN